MPIFGPKCQFWAKFGRFWAQNPIFWGQGVKILVPSYRDSNETPFSCWKHWSVGLKLAARGENVLFWPQNLFSQIWIDSIFYRYRYFAKLPYRYRYRYRYFPKSPYRYRYFWNCLIDNDIDIDIFKNDHIDIDIDIFNFSISISISISIFFKSVDISTIDISYRYFNKEKE